MKALALVAKLPTVMYEGTHCSISNIKCYQILEINFRYAAVIVICESFYFQWAYNEWMRRRHLN